MATPRASFTTAAAAKVVTATKLVLAQAIDQRGRRAAPPRSNSVDTSNVLVVLTSSLGGGVYDGTIQTGTPTGYSGSTITGLTDGAACIVINGPEFGTTATVPLLATGTGFPVPGYQNGSSDGTPMVFISAVTAGCPSS